MLTLVAEDSSGKIVDALYCEAVLDVTKIGCSRGGFEGAEVVVEDLRAWAKRRSFRLARIAVPKVIASRMAKTLERFGFVDADSWFSHWVRKL